MSVKKRATLSVERFIDKGADVKSSKDKNFKNVLVRMPTSILTQLDGWVEKKPWINRTQWIVEAIHEKLKSDCNEEEEKFGARN
jgi:hypothetical protein